MHLRALVVDDTVLFRTVVTRALEGLDVEVVASASNGRIGLQRAVALRPDVIFLDMEMPEMSGLDVLAAIRDQRLDIPTVVVSAVTVEGGELTMKALELGAMDFVTKPRSDFSGGGLPELQKELKPILKALEYRLTLRQAMRGESGQYRSQDPAVVGSMHHSGGVDPTRITGKPIGHSDHHKLDRTRWPVPSGKAEVIAIGVSTGGPQALISMLPSIRSLPVPLLIVQHMPPLFTATLARSLAARCTFAVKEGENGEALKPGTAYLAPGGRHIRVALGADGLTKLVRVTDDPPENNCRPSVDYLFRSVAHHFYGRSMVVVMTGMGADGLRGSELVKRAGGRVIAQDEASCVVYGMPKEIVDAGLADQVVPLERLAAVITSLVA
jgi:two-component system chemotaxis response regulator CheB